MSTLTEIDLDDRRLAVKRCGRGAPLLLLPGVGTHSSHWGTAFLDALGASAELVLLDHRGTGRSTRDRGPFAVADLAADARVVLAALDYDEADVLGFSLGAMVAQEMARSHGESVRRLVLLGAAEGGTGSRGIDAAALAPLVTAMREHDGEAALRSSWAANVSAGFGRDSAAFARWIAVNSAQPFAVATLESQLAAVAGYDSAPASGAIEHDTLLVHGGADAVAPVAAARALARTLSRAQLEVVEDAGHLVHWEAPEHVAGLIGRFLR